MNGPRLLFLGSLLLATALLGGCGSSASRQGDSANSQEFQQYPVRSDWLVKDVPNSSGQPSKWYEPGYPPLVMLNRPFETLKGDDALLVNQVRNRVVLNTRKVDEEVRDAAGKILTEMYGTPANPRVPSGEMLIGEQKLDEKLAEFGNSLAEVRQRLAQARKDAAAPADHQAADAIENSSAALEKDVAKLREAIDDLHRYDGELRLDPKTLQAGGVVFRNYCQQCHGLTGDGNGPGGRYLIPMPRDYRSGMFKFITTDPSLGSKRKPRREDLYRTITKGLDGSPMPQFSGLKEDEIRAVVSYVIHLSLRGETEFELMKKAADPAGADDMSKDDVRRELVKAAAEIIPRWTAAGRNPIVPDPDPYVTEEQIQKSAENGYRLFTSSEVGCATCHTNFGRAAPIQFDSWGTMVRPRNLTVATLRGGRSPDAVYDRIYGGILGSNMPAHPHLRPKDDEKGAKSHKIWDLVHFIQYLSEGEKRQILKDQFQIEIDQ